MKRQRLICIKEDNIDEETGGITPAPKVDEIVTLDYYTDDGYVSFLESEYSLYEYSKENFRELDEDFAESVLAKITKEVEEESLTLH